MPHNIATETLWKPAYDRITQRPITNNIIYNCGLTCHFNESIDDSLCVVSERVIFCERVFIPGRTLDETPTIAQDAAAHGEKCCGRMFIPRLVSNVSERSPLCTIHCADYFPFICRDERHRAVR